MRKKGLNIILITTVLGIWGIILFRMLSKPGTDPESSTSISAGMPVKQHYTERDTVRLVARYRDPFLGTVSRTENPVSAPTATATSSARTPGVPTVSPPVKEWPALSFHGTIRNTQSGKTVAILNISGYETRMNAGDTLSGIKLEKIFRDSVLLSMGKAKRVIKR